MPLCTLSLATTLYLYVRWEVAYGGWLFPALVSVLEPRGVILLDMLCHILYATAWFVLHLSQFIWSDLTRKNVIALMLPLGRVRSGMNLNYLRLGLSVVCGQSYFPSSILVLFEVCSCSVFKTELSWSVQSETDHEIGLITAQKPFLQMNWKKSIKIGKPVKLIEPFLIIY